MQPKPIPNIIHFIYGLDADFGGKEFCFAHYLAIKSAYVVNKPEKIFLYYCYEPPNNQWWEKAKTFAEPEKVDPPEEIYGNALHHVAHKADVIRLKKLIERGGIYLDMDTICVKPFTPLRLHKFVMGIQKDGDWAKGLCNAVMMSAKNVLFPKLWLESYKGLRSRGFDRFWDEHSVKIPFKLAQLLSEERKEIHIEPHTSFFYPYYHSKGLRMMFEEMHHFKEAYCHHLWESASYKPYLSKLTPEYINNIDTAYNLIARPFLDEDDFE